MGEEQGSQSFGYGTYVSNSKKIGEDYANLSAKEPIKTVTHNGKVVRQHSAWDNVEGRVAGFVAGANGNIEDARAHILTEIGYAEDELKSYKGNDKKKFSNTIERIKGIIRWYKEYLKAIDEGEWGYSEERMPRVVYDVEIPDDTPSDTGDYYNVETAGYYRKSKWKDSEEVIADLSEPDRSDAAADASKSQVPDKNGGELINAEAQTSSSESKDTKNNDSLQGNQEKSATESQENENNSLYSPIGGPHEPESERPRYQRGEDALHYAERLGSRRDRFLGMRLL